MLRPQRPGLVLAPRSPAMCGSATFAMEVSRTSIKAASATVAAISHGFAFGFAMKARMSDLTAIFFAVFGSHRCAAEADASCERNSHHERVRKEQPKSQARGK